MPLVGAVGGSCKGMLYNHLTPTGNKLLLNTVAPKIFKVLAK